jgi:hypothetical protein
MNYNMHIRRFYIVIVIVIVVIITSPLILIRYTMVQQAKDIAGNRPYCIMIRFFHKYINANPLNAIIPPIGGVNNYHAVLIVGYKENEELYHWSYVNRSFMEGAKGYSSYTICVPYKFNYENIKQSDYLEKLNFKVHNRTYSIPLVYRPILSGNRLVLSAHIPDLFPVRYDFNANRSDGFITIEPKPERLSRGRILVTPAGNETIYQSFPELEIAEFAYDLNKPNTVLRPGSGHNLFYAKNNNEISTVISCFNSADMPCSHKFIRGDLIYGFSYMPSHLSQWKILEEKVYQLLTSFHETASPNQSLHRTR